jgi:hypothetical protein
MPALSGRAYGLSPLLHDLDPIVVSESVPSCLPGVHHMVELIGFLIGLILATIFVVVLVAGCLGIVDAILGDDDESW